MQYVFSIRSGTFSHLARARDGQSQSFAIRNYRPPSVSHLPKCEYLHFSLDEDSEREGGERAAAVDGRFETKPGDLTASDEVLPPLTRRRM